MVRSVQIPPEGLINLSAQGPVKLTHDMCVKGRGKDVSPEKDWLLTG